MLDVFLRSGKREHEAEDQKKGNVEAGADHHAHVERAAAAAAFDVRWHAHLWYLCVPQAQMLIDMLPLRAVTRFGQAMAAPAQVGYGCRARDGMEPFLAETCDKKRFRAVTSERREGCIVCKRVASSELELLLRRERVLLLAFCSEFVCQKNALRCASACRRAIGAARRSHALARSAALQPHGAPLQPLAKVRRE